MPVYNVTVDDSSPMIIYSQGWIDSNALDFQLSSYRDSTFHATSDPGATVSFSFFGNAIYLFGAMRESYGLFTVSIDGQNTAGTSRAGSGNELFQRLLFDQTGLSNGEHTLVLMNNGTGVDVDFITLTTGDENSATQPGNSTVEDTAPQIIYKPELSAWSTTSSFRSFYHDNSFHESQVGGAQAVVSFTGDAVSVYGSTSQSHGTFSVQIDDRDPVKLNGSAPTFRPQTLLYWAGGIGPGQHQLEVANTQDQSFVDLDFLVTTSWTTSTSSPAPAHKSTSKTPIIAGVISGTCVGIAWIVALFYLLRRRRMRRRKLRTADVAEANPEPFILPPDPAVVDGSHRPGEYAFGNRPSGKVPPPRPQATSASTSSYPPASTSSRPTHTRTRSPNSRAPTSNLSISSLAAVESSQRLPPSAMASSHVLAPPRAGANPSDPESSSSQGAASTASPIAQSDIRPSISMAELSASRMTVPNRPQDWGPIIPLPDGEHEEGLPPDYQQATQPMPSVAAVVHHTP